MKKKCRAWLSRQKRKYVWAPLAMKNCATKTKAAGVFHHDVDKKVEKRYKMGVGEGWKMKKGERKIMGLSS